MLICSLAVCGHLTRYEVKSTIDRCALLGQLRPESLQTIGEALSCIEVAVVSGPKQTGAVDREEPRKEITV